MTIAASGASGQSEGEGVTNMVMAVNREKCILCGCCIEYCPTNAILIKRAGGEKRLVISGLLCEDCGECTYRCPKKGALYLAKMTF